MRRPFVLSAALLAAACASTPPEKPPVEVTPIVGAAQAPGAILYAWTQVVPSGTVALARAVVEGPGQPCPEIALDDQPGVVMTARPGRDGYPVTVCEHPLALPDGRPATRAQVADRLLPLPGTAPARIAVIGDADLARTAKTIARRQMPTLVVYAGDDRGDTWEERQRSFFEPAGELLQVAPWRMTGGNREDGDLPSHAVRLYERLLEESGEDHGYLMLVRKGPDGWEATLSSPKGDETRSCRFGEAGFDCGLPETGLGDTEVFRASPP